MDDQNKSFTITNLITKLCEVLYKDYLKEKSVNDSRVVANEEYRRNIKKLKSQVFEILLQRSNKSINCTHEEIFNFYNLNRKYKKHQNSFLTDNDRNVNFDPPTLMREYFLIRKIYYHNDYRNHSKLIKCENDYKNMKKKDHPLFIKSTQFLLAYIRKNKFDNENDFYETVVNDYNNNAFLSPAPFTLNASHEDKQLYDLKMSYSFNDTPIYFYDVNALNYQQSEFINEISENKGLLLNSDSNVNKENTNVCGFFLAIMKKLDSELLRLNNNQTSTINKTSKIGPEEGIIYEPLLPSNISHSPPNFQHLLQNFYECIPIHSEESYVPEFSYEKDSNSFFLSTQQPNSSLLEANRKIKGWNWENLSSNTISKHRPFVSEHLCSIHLRCFENKLQCRKFQVNVISLQSFLITLKYLTVGVSSDIFYIPNQDVNENVFTMLPNTTVENCLPSTTQIYALHFLIVGTCFRRLREMVKKSRKPKHNVNGFVYKALCDGVDEYLAIFRKFVYMEKDHSLLGYYKRIKHLMNPLENLTALMRLHPNTSSGSEFSMLGAKLLTYLCNEIIRTSDDHFLNLLVYILKHCCSVYFQHLHRWVFYGCLDDPYNELFIGHLNHYRLNTRYFYERSYFIKEDCVPHFINNFSKDILLCGKYTMLLKSCKPNHPIFKVEYPKLQVGLKYEDIKFIKLDSEKYKRLARAKCGPLVKTSEILNRKANKFKLLKEAFQHKTKENLIKNENIILKKQNSKNLIFDEIKANMEVAKKKKLDERTAHLVEEVLLKKLHEDNEMRLLEKDHEYLKRNLKDFQELRHSIDLKNEQLKENSKSNCGNYEHLNVKNQNINKENYLNLTPASEEYSFNSCLTGEIFSDYEDCHSNLDDQAKPLDANTKNYDKISICKNNNNNCELINKIINIYETPPLKNILKRTNNEKPAKSNRDFINNNLKNEIKRNRTKMMESSIPIHNQHEILTRTLNKSYLNDLGVEIRNRYQTSNIFNTINDLNMNNNISSENPVEGLTDYQKNRSRILKSQLFTNTLQVHKTRSRSDLKLDLMISSSMENYVKTINENITERERNKANVLRSEFDVIKNNCQVLESPKKIFMKNPTEGIKNKTNNLNCKVAFIGQSNETKTGLIQKSNKIELERTRNKLKVLNSEFDIPLNMDFAKIFDSGHNSKLTKVSTLNLDTERTERKAKDVGIENDCITMSSNEKSKSKISPSSSKIFLSVDHANDALTPMSTSSDQSVYAEYSCPIDLNGNISEKENHGNNDTKLNETRSTNLKSNGLCLHSGSSLDILDQTTKQHSKFLNIVSKSPMQDKSTNSVVQSSELVSDEKFYHRTLHLLASNFQCNSSNPFISQHHKDLNLSCLSKKTNLYENESSYLNKLQKMGNKKTCPIRITQYLQKSIMLPVNVHLELVQNEVLRLFFEDYNLMQHFRNLKNYFFMMNGEFGAKICQGIFKRFENGAKPSQLFYYPTLHSILDSALCSSSHTSDKTKSCSAQVSFVVSEVPENFDTNSPCALNNLNLTYEVHWPLNIILNSETIDKYGDIFKFLFSVRRMDYIMDISYEYLKDAAAKHGRALLISAQYVYIQFIRHKIHIFIKALQNHITASAIQSSWIQFKNNISQAKCLEEIYRIHTTYIKKITFLCMMNRKSSDFFDHLEKIFKIIIRFCRNLKRCEFKLGENGQFIHDRYERLLKDEADLQRLIIYMVHMGKKIVSKGYQSEIGQLIDLININDYYSNETFAKKEMK